MATQSALPLERRSPTRRETDDDTHAPGRRPALPKPDCRPALQWQREYWDTFMRDEEQERKAIRYIENNPVKAKLCRAPEEWAFSSAPFRDAYRRLVLPSGTPVSDPAGSG